MPAPVAIGAAVAGTAGKTAGAGAGATGAGKAGAGAGAGKGGASSGGATKAGFGTQSQIPKQALRHMPQQGKGKDDEEEKKRRKPHWLVGGVLAVLALITIMFCLVLVAAISAFRSGSGSSGNGYPVGSGVPPVYWPMYVAAATYYKVSPYLLASIHYQETRYSTADSSQGGYNSNGCCAGPMQFNVKGGTWSEYQNAFRPIADQRPAALYPSDRRQLPSCQGVEATVGCVYDDFDAIAAAAELLKRSGADTSLESTGTRSAVCSYIGSCLEVDECTGSENQYCQVLPRARKWEMMAEPTFVGGPLGGRIGGIAFQQLKKGVHEGAGNCNPYGYCAEWCAMFATWVWEHAGIHIRAAISRDGLSPYYVPDLETYAKAHGLWRSSPSPGAMILWGSHVGLVMDVLGDGRIVEVGGNQSDAVTQLKGRPDELGEGTPNGYMSPPEGGTKEI